MVQATASVAREGELGIVIEQREGHRRQPDPRRRRRAEGLGARETTLALSLLATALGCAELRLEIDLPAPEGMRSLVLVVEHDGELTAHGINLEHPVALPHLEPFRGEAQLYGLYYPEALGDLDVDAGAFTLVDPSGPGRPLPAPTVVLRANVRDKAASSWQDAADPRDALGLWVAERVNPRPHCVPISHRVFPLGTRSRVFSTLAESPTSLLAFAFDGEVFRVRTDGATRIELPGAPHPGPTGAAWGEDGEIWLGGGAGIYRGSLARGFEPVAGPENTRFLAGPPPGGGHPFELFALTDGAVLHRYDGEAWMQPVPTGAEPTSRHGGLSWTGPRRASLIATTSNHYYVWHDGRVRVSEVPASLGELNALTPLRSGEVVAATNRGVVFEEVNGELAPSIVGEPVVIRTLRTMGPLGQGLALIGQGLQVYHGVLGQPLCPALDVRGELGDLVALHAAPLGEALVVFAVDPGEREGRTETQVLVLELLTRGGFDPSL